MSDILSGASASEVDPVEAKVIRLVTEYINVLFEGRFQIGKEPPEILGFVGYRRVYVSGLLFPKFEFEPQVRRRVVVSLPNEAESFTDCSLYLLVPIV